MDAAKIEIERESILNDIAAESQNFEAARTARKTMLSNPEEEEAAQKVLADENEAGLIMAENEGFNNHELATNQKRQAAAVLTG